MIAIPVLQTERPRLRSFAEPDVDAYASLSAGPEVMRFLGSGKVLTHADAWRQIAFFLGHWELRGFGMWAVEERNTGTCIGRVGFLQPEGWPGFELGWVLDRAWWGKGYATEGARAALDYAFGELKRPHVISLIYPDNHASIRVAERLGETLEGETELFDRRVLIYGVRPAA